MKWMIAMALVVTVVWLVGKARRQGKFGGDPAHGGYLASDSGSVSSKDACTSDGAAADCGGGDGGGGD